MRKRLPIQKTKVIGADVDVEPLHFCLQRINYFPLYICLLILAFDSGF